MQFKEIAFIRLKR
jgi:hypothetical protein